MERRIDMPTREVLDGFINGKITGEPHVAYNRETGLFEHPIPLPESPHRVRKMPTEDQLLRFLDGSKPPFVAFNLRTGEFEG